VLDGTFQTSELMRFATCHNLLEHTTHCSQHEELNKNTTSCELAQWCNTNNTM